MRDFENETRHNESVCICKFYRVECWELWCSAIYNWNKPTSWPLISSNEDGKRAHPISCNAPNAPHLQPHLEQYEHRLYLVNQENPIGKFLTYIIYHIFGINLLRFGMIWSYFRWQMWGLTWLTKSWNTQLPCGCPSLTSFCDDIDA